MKRILLLAYILHLLGNLQAQTNIPDTWVVDLNCDHLYWEDIDFETENDQYGIILWNEQARFEIRVDVTPCPNSTYSAGFKIYKPVNICNLDCNLIEDNLDNQDSYWVDYEIEESAIDFLVLNESILAGMTELSFPCMIYLIPFSCNRSVSIRFENNNYQDSEFYNPNLNNSCNNSFQLYPSETIGNNTFHVNSGETHWYSALVQENTTDAVALTVSSDFDEISRCSEVNANIKIYGPFEECFDPCQAITLGNYLFDEFVISDLNTEQNLLSQPLNSEKFWLFKIDFTAYCDYCNYSLNFDVKGLLDIWSDPIVQEDDCEECLPSAGLIPNKKYILSLWAKEDSEEDDGVDPIAQTPYIQSYTDPKISISFNQNSPNDFVSLGPISIQESQNGGLKCTKGQIVEGWQMMEVEFVTPNLVTAFGITFYRGENPVLYDDIRIFPADGSMKSYVYDPANLRFVAELDERNFATLYEYDEEGKLQRIKKETERGIVTIQESKNHTLIR